MWWDASCFWLCCYSFFWTFLCRNYRFSTQTLPIFCSSLSEWCLVVVTISVLEAGCWAPLLCAVLGHTASSDKRGRVRCLQVPHGPCGRELCTQLLHIKLLTLLLRVRFLQEQTRPFFSCTLCKDTLLGLAGRWTYMQTYLCANTSL